MAEKDKQPAANATAVEWIKHKSNFLRGRIVEDLADGATGSVSEESTQLIKFHGIYQQDDRDTRKERMASKLEFDYSFMIRMRLPGGELSAKQMQCLIDLALGSESASLKLTTRQSVQLHGILKHKLRDTITAFNQQMIDSIAACGDVNRNVMCSPFPVHGQRIHRQILDYAHSISSALMPQSKAWHEIWINGYKLLSDDKKVKEAIYGNHYLPRKFKIGIAVPPNNDVDIFSQDIGLIAIIDKDELQGFNVLVGGGLGTTHGDSDTRALLALPFGFCPVEKVLSICQAILEVQRDHGNRSNRKQARTKYTLRTLGKEKFIQLVEERSGYRFQPLKDYAFNGTDDSYGWCKSGNECFRILPVENGRMKDTDSVRWFKALSSLATKDLCSFQITANQNIMIRTKSKNQQAIDDLLTTEGINDYQQKLSQVRKMAMACTAFSSCSLAMAEAERYLPSLLQKIEPILARHNLAGLPIIIRMTGCPNGCGRSRLSEIGFVGKALGRYQMFLGASTNGDRLNRLYKDNLDESSILSELDVLFARFAKDKHDDESFGDFAERTILPTLADAVN